MKMYKYLTLLFFALGCTSKQTSHAPQSIYGEDNRVDIYQSQNSKMKEFAQSTVALVENQNIVEGRFKVKALGEKLNLCTTEKFREQPSAAFCTGFLAADDIVVTAGHCFKAPHTCESISFVFDFALTDAATAVWDTKSDNIFRCKNIIKAEHGQSKVDFAVVRLDRKVTGRNKLALNSSGTVQVNELVATIGNPAGLPTKIAENGRVIKIDAAEYFEATLDSFGGNSGAPVFNQRTGLVEGIIVRGKSDFNVEGACTTSKIYEENSPAAEDVTRTKMFAQYLGGTVEPDPDPTPTPTVTPTPTPTPDPGYRPINEHAEFSHAADLTYRLADAAESLQFLVSDDIRQAARNLHMEGSDFYRALQNLDFGSSTDRRLEIDRLSRRSFPLFKMTYLDLMRLRPTGSSEIRASFTRIENLYVQIENELF